MLGLTKIAGTFFKTSNASEAAITSIAPRTKARSVLLRPILDAAVALVVLCMLGMTLNTAPSSASPNVPNAFGYQVSVSSMVMKAVGAEDVRPVVEIATTSSPNSPEAVYGRTSAQAAWALLMIALSVVVSLNLALFRHMRQAYTPPRRRNPQA